METIKARKLKGDGNPKMEIFLSCGVSVVLHKGNAAADRGKICCTTADNIQESTNLSTIANGMEQLKEPES